MNKTTVRWLAIGAGVVLGAIALVLAQHDSRQARESAVISLPEAQDPQPIPIDDSPLWNLPNATLVRANDDDSLSAPPSLEYDPRLPSEASSNLPTPTQSNPLRGSAPPSLEVDDAVQAGQFDDESYVQTASGEAPVEDPPAGFPNLPVMPLLPGAANTAAAPVVGGAASAPLPVPQLPGSSPATASIGDGSVIKPPPPGWLQIPAGAPPAGNSVSTPRPASQQSLSDTQRAAMPATNLSGSSTGAGTPDWIQAPIAGSAVAIPSATSPSGPPPTTAIPAAPSATLGTPRPTAPSASTSSTTLPSATSSPAGAASAAYSGTILGRLVSNQPGNSHLAGSQNPIMLVQKRMPEECQVGKPANVVITVRNAGNATAQDVEVIDSVPGGASFAESIPATMPSAEGLLVWKLGEMGPGDERTINLQIVPERQGELGSTAVVRFAVQAAVRTLATLPKLELSFQAKPDVLIGSIHSTEVTLKNIGTGVARSVKLEAELPTALRHESGVAILEAPFGDIAPGEQKQIRLDTIAAEPGATAIALHALTDDGLQQEQQVDLRVLAPQLQAVITGPSRRYLDRQATFEIMIQNPGTAAATNCEFVLRLPAGLNFNVANKAGHYDAAQHAVYWSVPEFPAGHSEAVQLTVLPVEIGAQQLNFQATADLGVKSEARGGLTVEEQGELTFSISQDADPVELSASTTFTVEVRSVGRPDRNVELSLQLPPGSEVLKVDAPVQARVDGDTLRFEPIPQLDGRTALKFRVEVRHGKVGLQIVRAQLKSQNRPTLVIKEEATEVYNDRE